MIGAELRKRDTLIYRMVCRESVSGAAIIKYF